MASRSFRLLVTGFCIALSAALIPARTVTASSGSSERGAELFATKGCAHCHGERGIGGNIGPDLSEVRKRLKPDAIAHQIHDGGKSMPPYGDQLSDSEISDLVAYLRTRRKPLTNP